MAVGQRFTDENAYAAMKAIKGGLETLGVVNWSLYTLKSFRAGRATAMAASGDTLASILQAGEWKSSAFLNYISESEVDRVRMLDHAMMDDEEDEDLAA